MDRQRARSAKTAATCSSARSAAPTTTTSCTSSISATRPAEHRRADQADRRNPRRRIHADRELSARASTCAPTRMRRTAASSRSISNTSSVTAWKVVVPEQPHAIENAALVGGRIVVHSLVDVQSRIQLFGARRHPRSGGSAAGPRRGHRTVRAAGRLRSVVRLQLAARRRRRCIATTSNRGRGCRSKSRCRRSTRRNSRRARCLRPRRTARGCRSS